MSKKKINILTFIILTLAVVSIGILIFLCIRHGSSVLRYLRIKKTSDYDTWKNVFYTSFVYNLSTLILCLFVTIFCLSVSAFLIYLFYRINKTAILSTTENISDYRKQQRKLKAEKRKAKLVAELEQIDKVIQ